MKWHRSMDDERIRMESNNKKKNKNLISRNVSEAGGNGIVGLALVVVGFIAVVSLSINKNRKKHNASNPKPTLEKSCENLENNEIETNQGLHVFLHPSSSTTTTNDGDAASCHETTDTKSINDTFILEEKIDTVPDTNIVNEEVSATSVNHQEIVLSDDSYSESATSTQDSGTGGIDENSHDSESQNVELEIHENLQSIEAETVNDDAVVSEPDFDCKDEEEEEKIEMQQNEEHVAGKTESEVTKETESVETEITCYENGNLSMEVNGDEPLVSHSFQLTTLLMLLPGLFLLLILLLLMHLTQQIHFTFLQ